MPVIPFCFPLHILFCNIRSFIIELLSFCESHLDLHKAALEIDLKRHERKPFLPNLLSEFSRLGFYTTPISSRPQSSLFAIVSPVYPRRGIAESLHAATVSICTLYCNKTQRARDDANNDRSRIHFHDRENNAHNEVCNA